jgi:hypothetical protein
VFSFIFTIALLAFMLFYADSAPLSFIFVGAKIFSSIIHVFISTAIMLSMGASFLPQFIIVSVLNNN